VPAKILIVDDAAFSRATLKDLLIGAGYEIAGLARDGDEGIFLYEILRPDVVTMDLVMPRRDGLSAIHAIRRFDAEAQIVVCSALTDAKVVREALLAGARDFIVKPYDPKRVVEAISRAVVAREKVAYKVSEKGADVTNVGPKQRV
jgi:two-component system chemotaxis response regulator CheY